MPNNAKGGQADAGGVMVNRRSQAISTSEPADGSLGGSRRTGGWASNMDHVGAMDRW